METSVQNPSPISVASKPLAANDTKKQIRLLILVILLFLSTVIYSFIILGNRSQKQNLPASLTVQPKQSTVTPQKDYKNPFDKNAQYVNPFSQYKNPFDIIK